MIEFVCPELENVKFSKTKMTCLSGTNKVNILYCESLSPTGCKFKSDCLKFRQFKNNLESYK